MLYAAIYIRPFWSPAMFAEQKKEDQLASELFPWQVSDLSSVTQSQWTSLPTALMA